MHLSKVTITDPVGLHARPAAMFVKLAGKFAADISIRNVTTSGQWANAKSILGLLTCGAKHGDEIEVRAEGADEQAAVTALEELVRSNFPAK